MSLIHHLLNTFELYNDIKAINLKIDPHVAGGNDIVKQSEEQTTPPVLKNKAIKRAFLNITVHKIFRFRLCNPHFPRIIYTCMPFVVSSLGGTIAIIY